MFCSLILGRKGSIGFPGKNTYDIYGHPLAWYPMQAALSTVEIDKNFISTDDSELMELGRELGFEVIERPDYLATSEALGDDAYKHGYEEIRDKIREAFFTTKAVGKGTGLGMSICQRIIDAHGGTLVVGDSVEFGGASMIVWLPLNPEQERVDS